MSNIEYKANKVVLRNRLTIAYIITRTHNILSSRLVKVAQLN